MGSENTEPRRVALVTGGVGGIGLEIAAGLLAHGLDVVVTSRSTQKAEAAADRLRLRCANGVEVLGWGVDVTDHEALESLVGFIASRWGRLDVLVNNAGIYLEAPHMEPPRPSLAQEQPVDMVRESFEVNLLGPYRLTQLVVPVMRRQGYGRIVNVASGSGQLAEMGGGEAGYRMSKTALNAMTRIFSAELRGTGVLVNSMCPGWVNTDMGGPDAPRTPEEGADTAIWLATLSDDGPNGGFFRDREPIAF